MDTKTSRRALIGGAGLAAIVAAAPALSAIPASSQADPHWKGLIAAFQHADATMNALGQEHNAASTAYMAGRKLLGEKPTEPPNEYPKPLAEMLVAELWVADFRPSKERQDKYNADLAAWTAYEADLDRRTMGDVDERWEASVTAQDMAAHAILAHPAPDIAGLLFKLELAESQYRNCDLDKAVTAHLFADVRRLAGREG